MRRYIFLCIFLLLMFILTGRALASSGGDYELSWWTVDGGGGVSSGGEYSLSGTIGQHDTGTMSGGEYGVAGGFWARSVPVLIELFLPIIMR